MSRFGRDGRVFFFEEPIFTDGETALDVDRRDGNLFVIQPKLPHGTDGEQALNQLRKFLDELIVGHDIHEHISWYYTPMMFRWSSHLTPKALVYDCMDELSAFRNAPAELVDRERELLSAADVVFTGGQSLYEAKKDAHPSVHAFPSSIDVKHFAKALKPNAEPDDMAGISRPRIGFIGVIDERLDIDLLDQIAQLGPDFEYVMIGPVVKIDVNDLPRRKNIHYLGAKAYDELPFYIGTWDVAILPFAINESTRYISPTKTPEYLAAGRPVVSTPIRDVVRPYGDQGLVQIASSPDEFVRGIETALNSDGENRRAQADEFLSNMSWDVTYRSMLRLIDEAIGARPNMAARSAKSVGFS